MWNKKQMRKDVKWLIAAYLMEFMSQEDGSKTLKDVFFMSIYQQWLPGLVEKNHAEQFYG